jgi:EmrB/QacA subfamily drug resistance transporter
VRRTREPIAGAVKHVETAVIDARRRWQILAVLCLSLLVVGIDTSILNVAIPTLVRDIGATPAQVEWILDAYILVFAGFLLTAGRLGDRLGRKGVLSAGLLVFGTASLLGALSTSSAQLIVTRALMGAGAALIMPATLSILVNVFTEPRERLKAIAYWSLMAATSAFIGPVAGGLLLRQFWWGSVFLVNVPIVLVAWFAGHWLIPTSRDPEARGFDVVGAILSFLALGALLWSIIEGPAKGWLSGLVIGGFLTMIVLGALFVWWERRCPDPMLDMTTLGTPQLSAACTSILVASLAISGTMFITVQVMQFAKGYTPLASAFATSIPIVVMNFILMPRSPALKDRFGARTMMTIGLALIAACSLVFATVTVDSGYLNIFLGFVLMASGFSMFIPASTEAVMTSFSAAKAGSGSSLNQMSRTLGQALGIALVGSVVASSYRSQFSAAHIGAATTKNKGLARESINGAIGAAKNEGGKLATAILDASHQAFVSSMRIGLIVVALLAVGGALFAAWAVPSERARAIDGDELLTERLVEATAILDEVPGGG